MAEVNQADQPSQPVGIQPESLDVTLEQVEEVVQGIVQALSGRKFSVELIIPIVSKCMEISARMQVSNHTKKEIVTTAMKKYIIEKSGLNAEEQAAVSAVANVIISKSIDTLADVANGKIKVSQNSCCVIL
jgi:hypothetical protein